METCFWQMIHTGKTQNILIPEQNIPTGKADPWVKQ
jgi:hypothetical protein